MNKKTRKTKLPKGIILRKDGRYMARYEHSGEKYTLYNRSLAQLEKELTALKYKVESKQFHKESNILVKDWFDEWMKEYKQNTVKVGTLYVYRDNFRLYIEPAIGEKHLKDIQPIHIQSIYNKMSEKYTHSTIEITAVVLNGLFKQAYKNELIHRNPVPLATLPREKK